MRNDWDDRPNKGGKGPRREFDGPSKRPQYGGQPRRDGAARTEYGPKDDAPRGGKQNGPSPNVGPRPSGPATNAGPRPPRPARFKDAPSGGRHYDNPNPGPRLAKGPGNVPPARRMDGPMEPLPAVPVPIPVPAPVMPDLPVEQDMDNLLVGRNPIREALRAGRPLEKLLVAKGDLSSAAREIVRMARDAGVIVQTVDRNRLDAIYPAHQGILAYASMAEYSTVEEILDYAREQGEDPFVILLDGVTDPHNLGAIVRTAECAGAHGVIIPERRAAGLGPAAAKAAAGALDYMRVARVKNLNRTAEELKEAGLWVVATALEGEDVYKADLTGPIALVIGSEGDGISRLMLERSDRRVTLPMKGHIDSLNASVAAGIVIYEIARARRG